MLFCVLVVEVFFYRHLKGEDITSLPYKELMAIEDALENGLTYVRGKQDSRFCLNYLHNSTLYELKLINLSFLFLSYRWMSLIRHGKMYVYSINHK